MSTSGVKAPFNAAPWSTIVFFDGTCGLCHGFVGFLLRHDPSGIFRFAPLQGDVASRLLPDADIQDLSSVVLWHEGRRYYRSAAVLASLRMLPGILGATALFVRIFPRSFRDFVYGMVAGNRKRFWPIESCRMPTPEERTRFLP